MLVGTRHRLRWEWLMARMVDLHSLLVRVKKLKGANKKIARYLTSGQFSVVARIVHRRMNNINCQYCWDNGMNNELLANNGTTEATAIEDTLTFLMPVRKWTELLSAEWIGSVLWFWNKCRKWSISFSDLDRFRNWTMFIGSISFLGPPWNIILHFEVIPSQFHPTPVIWLCLTTAQNISKWPNKKWSNMNHE